MPSTIDDDHNLTATQTKSGALYATETNGTAQFGTLPVAQGGTGVNSITSGNLLVGAGTNDITSIAKTSTNTANTVVQRDASGNFSAGTITASLSGNATTATTLKNAKTLKVNLASTSASTGFDGSANITDIGVSGILPVGNGGTGRTSHVANRLVRSNGDATAIVGGDHYADASHIGVNTLEIPTDANGDPYHLYVTGKMGITSNIVIKNNARGLYLTDTDGNVYPGIYHNSSGNNLWIGSTNNNGPHHTGGTFISAGVTVNGNTTTGNKSIYVALPNDSNNGATNYKIVYGTGGSTSRPVYVDDDGKITAITGAIANDTTGNAATATKLGTADKGSTNKPIYLDAGVPKTISYEINKTVPADADFDNTKVTQTETTDSNNRFAVLLSSTASNDDTGSTITSTARKASNFSYNPSFTRLRISRSDHDQAMGLYLDNSDTTNPLTLGYIIGTANGGIYDYTHGVWKLSITPDGTTSLNGNASTATKATQLETAREIYTNLSSVRDTNNKITFDGTATKGIAISGTLGLDHGGTGYDLSDIADGAIIRNSGSGYNGLRGIAPASGALYATSATDLPSFGTLPIAQGGTGRTSHTANRLVRTNGDATAIVGGDHYADASHIGVNTTTIPNDANGNPYQFYVTGKMGISSNIIIKTTDRGLYLTDSSGTTYPGICDNGANLWIGASKSASTHHIGQTFISTGYDATNNTGYKSAYLALPNDSNNGASTYRIVYGSGGSASVPTYVDSNGRTQVITTFTVDQSATTASSWRKVLLNGGSSDTYTNWNDAVTATTAVTYQSRYVAVQPSTGSLRATKVYGAVYNDYAEMRNVPEAQNEDNPLRPGTCVREVGDGTMIATTERLQRGCKIISDTFGFNIGETDDCQTPIAVSGRALVYLDQDREIARDYIGWPVCSGPNGTVSIMTEEEEEKYPSRIVGTISEIPNYEKWGSSEVEVNGRIWIYVK